jgi:hypothetical protein
MRRRWFLLLGWLLTASLGASSDLLEMPLPAKVGVRALGMGDAYTSVAEGASGVFHNPAGLGVGQGVHLFGQTHLNGRDIVKFDPKGIAYRWRGTGVAWGNKIAIRPEGTHDYTYWSVGRRLSSAFAVGLSAKFWRIHPSRHFQVFGQSPTYDVGLFAALSERVRVAGRFGTRQSGKGVETASVGWLCRGSRVLASVESEWQRDSGLSWRLGVERRLFSRWTVRAGWNGDAPTLGAGIRIGGTRLDAGWTTLDGNRLFFIGAELGLSDTLKE